MKIGFIGMGNMAYAIATGFINSSKVDANDVYAYAPSQDKLLMNSKRLGFHACTSNDELIDKSDLIIIACKPQQIADILSSYKDAFDNKAIISIAAGWTYDSYAQKLNASTRIQCIMPNTPAMVGEGVILFEECNSLTAQESAYATDIFSSLGIVERLPSKLMNVGCAVSGCGPAFMDMMIEGFADAAVKYGIKRDLAYRIVSQTMLGSAKLQLSTGKHPGILKDEVCSPAGSTIKGVASLEKNGFRGLCIDCIDEILS